METPEFFDAGYYNAQFTPEKRHCDNKAGDHFIIDDLLNFPNDDSVSPDPTFESLAGGSTESSAVTVVNSCNSSFSGGDPPISGEMGSRNLAADSQFSSELCVPYDDLAELEWLSNFTEESFSTEDLQKLQIISGMKARPDESSDTQENPTRNNPIFSSEVSVPGKARSKRSRAAPGNWTSRLLAVSTPVTLGPASPELNPHPVVPNPVSSSGKKMVRKKEVVDNASGGEGRRCLHCATDKTPQWRTGPMGPKTLCNACGVRYKSGRLVPEYRPASSPTFVLTKHSNSHRKVMELRRQKEVQRAQQQQQQFIHQNMMFDVSNGEDYLIHQHLGPDFRQLI